MTAVSSAEFHHNSSLPEALSGNRETKFIHKLGRSGMWTLPTLFPIQVRGCFKLIKPSLVVRCPLASSLFRYRAPSRRTIRISHPISYSPSTLTVVLLNYPDECLFLAECDLSWGPRRLAWCWTAIFYNPLEDAIDHRACHHGREPYGIKPCYPNPQDGGANWSKWNFLIVCVLGTDLCVILRVLIVHNGKMIYHTPHHVVVFCNCIWEPIIF